MYTKMTKSFGSFKEDRYENVFYKKIMLSFLLFSFSILTFILLLNFIILVKIKQEFYFHKFYQNSDAFFIANNSFYFQERTASVEVVVIKMKDNDVYIFDDGKIVYKEDDLSNYLKKRRNNIIVTSMLSRKLNRSISRIKIWTNSKIDYKKKENIIRIFNKYGFDDFDFISRS